MARSLTALLFDKVLACRPHLEITEFTVDITLFILVIVIYNGGFSHSNEFGIALKQLVSLIVRNSYEVIIHYNIYNVM